jgi:hypothetical protein
VSESTPLFPLGSTAIVNCSTGADTLMTLSGMRARSCVWSYSVPHCPVCLLTIRFHADPVQRLYSEYLPAGIVVEPMRSGRSVTSVVEAFAPVRHTVFDGTRLP